MKSGQPKSLKVLFAASEAEPFIKIGGLGDVAGTLPYALQSYFKSFSDLPVLDLRIFLPFHSKIPRDKFKFDLVDTFFVAGYKEKIEARVFLCNSTKIPVYFIAGEPIPLDAAVYDVNSQVDGRKFAFFSRAVLIFCVRQNWIPDILHANDWHTALMPYLIRESGEFRNSFIITKTILGVHNLPFMGGGTQAGLESMNIHPTKDFRLPKWAKQIPLPMGMANSDRIIAVSPGYASEILTPEFGCGLDGFLFTRKDNLLGILNGLDTSLWNPISDPLLVENFSRSNLEKRLNNKQEIVTRLGMEYNPRTPFIIMISRLDQQKGVDFAIKALKNLTERKFQVAILGVGDPVLEDACRKFVDEYPERICWLQRFDQTLSHQLYASGDMILIPSRYEPCGLTQMIAMRYGCVPIARKTGGLRDTIRDENNPNGQTGFLFDDANAEDCEKAIEKSLNGYRDQEKWTAIQKNGMRVDFSWKISAKKYADEYLKLVNFPSI